MKKIVILLGLISFAGGAYAMPNVDVSAGGLPFRMMQEAMVEEQEAEDMNSKNEDMKFLKRIKRPAKVNLQQLTPSEFERPVQPSEMQMIEENGKIKIKPVN